MSKHKNKIEDKPEDEIAGCGGKCDCACNHGNSDDVVDETAQLINDLNQQIDEQSKASADLQDRLLRLQAEFDNYRRRTQKEKEDLINRATEEVVCKMLPVIDSFERGLSSGDKDVETITKGFELIHRLFVDFLTQVGVESINACGCEFDPNLHNAVMRVESEEHADDTVVEELQKGYSLRGKVIRPSMVKVAAK
ncbi:MAG: nucleotide exchange factor GrpE [Negativicutes bacterium]|jgi:molecular chaperone GrpE